MRMFKKLNAALALSLTLALAAPISTPATPVAVAEAATVKINKEEVTLKTGETCKLKISGTSEKVTWKSSKKKVAKVNKKGKVTAKGVGEATITAKAGDQKFTCKITVESSNEYVDTAPYEAKEVVATGFSFVAPKDWYDYAEADTGAYAYVAVPSEDVLNPSIIIAAGETGSEALDYELLKEIYIAETTEDKLIAALESKNFSELTITSHSIEDFECNVGTAFKLSYSATGKLAGMPTTFAETIYVFTIDNYLIQVSATNYGNVISTPDVFETADYLVRTLTTIK